MLILYQFPFAQGTEDPRWRGVSTVSDDHHVAILHHIVFAFHFEQSFLLGLVPASGGEEVGRGHYFRANERPFEIGMDRPGRLRRFLASLDGPGTRLVFARGQEAY